MQKGTILNIGFDDTDSPRGMCTTYLAYRMVDSLKKEGVRFLDYPRLVRLNPNIPWKTRGNGAVALKVMTDRPSTVKRKVIRLVSELSDLKNGANPGVVFLESNQIPKDLADFSRAALWKLIGRREAKKFVRKHGIESFHIGNGQGLIGAIGAIGYEFGDHTYELLSYREKSKFGKKREIDGMSVKKMQEQYERTFNSYDTERGRVLLAPRGPDPVLYGVRGEDIHSLLGASKMIKSSERPAGYLVFKSNQGTGDHLQNELDVSSLEPYSSGTLTGVISRGPQTQKGGHVMFYLEVRGVEMMCAVYRPTGMTREAMGLIAGDLVCVGGGIRKASKKHPRALNVEFLKVVKLQERTVPVNPLCIKCNKKMKSKGKGQGFECIRCGRRQEKKVVQNLPRTLKKQLYMPQPSAHRHLTRPQKRIGIANRESAFEDGSGWFSIYRNRSSGE